MKIYIMKKTKKVKDNSRGLPSKVSDEELESIPPLDLDLKSPPPNKTKTIRIRIASIKEGEPSKFTEDDIPYGENYE